MTEVQLIQDGVASLSLFETTGRPRVEFHSRSLFSLYRVEVGEKKLAAKIMKHSPMAKSEAEGLIALRNSGANAPECYGIYEKEKIVILFMEFITSGFPRSKDDLVENLSILYRTEHKHWGWQSDNFIGTLKQPNRIHSCFAEYFWTDRIEAQAKSALNSKLISRDLLRKLERVVAKRSDTWQLDRVGPRMIHGDLWGGNVLYSQSGKSYLIDPSISYGHPEQDLAMLELFGSPFSESDIRTIGRAFGYEAGFAERLPFWQIYPLLVHVNIFGSSYLSPLEQAVRASE